MHVHLLHKRNQPKLDRTIDALETAGATVQPLASDDASHIAELLDHQPIERLIISGGDGMIHHAVQSLHGRSIEVGIVPAGTGNDIARALGIPGSVAKAAALALGPTTPMDLIAITDSHNNRSIAVSVLTAGFSGVVTDTANRITWAGGQLKYTLATLRCLPRLETHRVTGLETGDRFSILAFGNTRFFGGGMAICPTARPTDGRMQLVVVDAVNPAHLALVLPTAFIGQHIRSRKVHHQRIERVTVEIDASWWADGEPLPQRGPVTIESLPKALSVAGAFV